MEQRPEINWSEVARNAFEEKIDDLEMMDRLSSGSELTDESHSRPHTGKHTL